MNKRFTRPAILLSVAALAISALGVVAADETTGTAEVMGGTLTNTAPASVTFGSAVTLDGSDQTITDSSLVLGVNDATGSGAGWKLDITSTTFTSGTDTLPTDATQVTVVASACADGSTCTVPSNSVGHPLTVPADATAPAALPLFNAAVDSGIGDIDLTPTVTIDIAANTRTGTYTSTITTTVSTGP